VPAEDSVRQFLLRLRCLLVCASSSSSSGLQGEAGDIGTLGTGTALSQFELLEASGPTQAEMFLPAAAGGGSLNRQTVAFIRCGAAGSRSSRSSNISRNDWAASEPHSVSVASWLDPPLGLRLA
jgi:hypothetical protein